MKKYTKLTVLILIFSVALALALGCIGCKEQSSDDKKNDPFAPPPSSETWTMTTPAGITVITARSTIAQYESLWGYWGNIDWVALDELFAYRKDYFCYQLNWDCKDTIPGQLMVYVKPWDSRCVDEESPTQPKEIYAYINGEWQCVDGWYWKRVVYFHLGDDPGWDRTVIYNEEPLISGDFYAFQETAYEHELMHFFQEMAGLPSSDEVYMGNVLTGSPQTATQTYTTTEPENPPTSGITLSECLIQIKEAYPEMSDQEAADNCFYMVTALNTNDKNLCKELSEEFRPVCEQQFQ